MGNSQNYEDSSSQVNSKRIGEKSNKDPYNDTQMMSINGIMINPKITNGIYNYENNTEIPHKNIFGEIEGSEEVVLSKIQYANIKYMKFKQ